MATVVLTPRNKRLFVGAFLRCRSRSILPPG